MKIKLLKLIDILIGKLLCLFLGWIDYTFNLTNKKESPINSKKVLFIRPGGLGDFLFLLPTIKRLKQARPDLIIHVLAEKRNQLAKELSDSIDKNICYDVNPLSTIKELLLGNYAIVIDSEQFHNFSAILAYITKAKIRIGFKTNPYRNHLYSHLIDYSLSNLEPELFLRLLTPLGIKDHQPVIYKEALNINKILATPPPKEFTTLKELGKSIIIISPRGQTKYRHWSAEKYVQVIQYLLKKEHQAVVLTGSKTEQQICAEIMGKIKQKSRLVNLTNKTNLLTLSNLLVNSDLFVGCDSGVAILAALLGIKTVTLFGSADERKWAIQSDQHLVVRKTLPCSPCQMLGNYKFCRNIDCMEQLSAEQVISTIGALGF